MFFSLSYAINVDESLVCAILAFSHLLSKNVELFKLQIVKLVIIGGCGKVGRLMDHNITHLVYKQTLLRRQQSKRRRHLQSESMNELLKIKLFVDLNSRLAKEPPIL